jgi:hypothetical protein
MNICLEIATASIPVWARTSDLASRAHDIVEDGTRLEVSRIRGKGLLNVLDGNLTLLFMPVKEEGRLASDLSAHICVEHNVSKSLVTCKAPVAIPHQMVDVIRV